MRMPDLYNEGELLRCLEIQQKRAWDIDKDIPWELGVDLDKPLLPLNAAEPLFPNATPKQKLVISQVLGLVVSEAFNEFEMSLERYKEECWTNILRKHPVSPEMWDLGEEFFEDEAKHSEAFSRYTAAFAKEVNVTPEELKSLLPQMENHKLTKLFKVDAYAGGVALWWMGAAVEEESIRIFKYMKGFKEDIDPLFFNLHKRHFEEEVRHACYAFLMLELIQKRAKTPIELALKKLDYLISDAFQMAWTFSTLMNLKKASSFKGRHEFFDTLCEVLPMLKDYSPIELVHKLFTKTPFISMILNPLENEEVKKYIKKNKSFVLPKPKVEDQELTCEF